MEPIIDTQAALPISLENLPEEAVQAILSRLPYDDLIRVSKTSTQLRSTILDIIKRKEVPALKIFFRTLQTSPMTVSNTRFKEGLSDIEKRINQKSISLKEYGSIIQDLTKQLETLGSTNLYLAKKSLNESQATSTVQSIFREANFNIRIQETENKKDRTYSQVELLCEDLARAGFYKKALRALKLQTGVEREWIAKSIANIALERGDFANAFKAASKLAYHLRDCAILNRKIAEKVVGSQDLDPHISSICFRLPDAIRNEALTSIVSKLTEDENFDKALELASLITDEIKKETYIGHLACVLAQVGQSDRAIALLQNLNNPGVKNVQLCELGQVFARQHNFERALKFADEIQNPYLRDSLIKTILSSAHYKLDKEKLVEIASKLSDPEEKRFALENINKRRMY